MGQRQVNYQIESADMMMCLGTIVPKPFTETQAHELVGLDAETAALVMKHAQTKGPRRLDRGPSETLCETTGDPPRHPPRQSDRRSDPAWS